jgi:hypothetical protein
MHRVADPFPSGAIPPPALFGKPERWSLDTPTKPYSANL